MSEHRWYQPGNHCNPSQWPPRARQHCSCAGRYDWVYKSIRYSGSDVRNSTSTTIRPICLCTQIVFEDYVVVAMMAAQLNRYHTKRATNLPYFFVKINASNIKKYSLSYYQSKSIELINCDTNSNDKKIKTVIAAI